MKNNTNFKINVTAGTIEMTKKVEKEIQNINSQVYLEFVQLKRDFPDYKMVVKTIKKNEAKESYKGLTIKEMERFVATQGESATAKFKQVQEVAEARKGSYAIIKKWFLDNYKEAYSKEIEQIAA